MYNNYEKDIFTEVVKKSKSLSDIARILNLEPSKGNRDTIKKYISLYEISVEHFSYVNKQNRVYISKTLDEILVEKSTYCRTNLKK